MVNSIGASLNKSTNSNTQVVVSGRGSSCKQENFYSTVRISISRPLPRPRTEKKFVDLLRLAPNKLVESWIN